MSELGPEELAVLARARRGLTPSARDAARVRAAVDATVMAGGATSVTREPVRGPSVPPAAMAGAAKLGAIVALAAATGLGGYVLGFRAGVAQREQSRAALAAVPSVVVPPAPVVRAPLADGPTLRHEPSPLPAGPPPLAKTERSGSVPAPSAAPSAVAPAPGSPETSLELETRLLARVERSLRDDNPRLALGLLGELDRTVPGGQLTEERQAARAMAHCELGSQTAPKLALAFLETHPTSAYAPRVREACRAALEKSEER